VIATVATRRDNDIDFLHWTTFPYPFFVFAIAHIDPSRSITEALATRLCETDAGVFPLLTLTSVSVDSGLDNSVQLGIILSSVAGTRGHLYDARLLERMR
jgi:hypothetical protein